MDKFHRSNGLFRRRKLMDSMTKVEDMTIGVFSIVKNIANTFFQFFFRQQKSEWIKISLQCNFSNTFGGITNIDTSVKAENIST